MSSVKSAQSILRRPSMAGKCSATSSPAVASHGLNLGSPMQTRAVHFEPPSNLRDLLIRASNEKNYNPKLLEELEGHLTHLKNQRGQVKPQRVKEYGRQQEFFRKGVTSMPGLRFTNVY
jgi:hypothetical protein